MTTTIAAPELLVKTHSGAKIELLDVRTPLEFRAVHVEFAKNIPLDQLDPESIKQVRKDSSEPLYVVCQSGGRSKQACDRLEAAGISNVVNVAGGTAACVEAGLPVVRGKKAMSLERQVRITAGSLVLCGCLLGILVHPLGFGLSLFVGAGLVFSGVTDTCGMGMILARMPWNRIGT
jgi:rhodanese-related sulfurtransferase